MVVVVVVVVTCPPPPSLLPPLSPAKTMIRMMAMMKTITPPRISIIFRFFHQYFFFSFLDVVWNSEALVCWKKNGNAIRKQRKLDKMSIGRPS